MIVQNEINPIVSYSDLLACQLEQKVCSFGQTVIRELWHEVSISGRTVLTLVILLGVAQENDFQWLCQLRYYWEQENCLVRITNATVRYGYEYLGNSGRSVVQRCLIFPSNFYSKSYI